MDVACLTPVMVTSIIKTAASFMIDFISSQTTSHLQAQASIAAG
jgi:hypothetical protein